MADAASYDPQALLSKPLDEVKAPVPLPLGEFVGEYVSYTWETRKTKEGDKTVCKWMVQPIEPLPSISPDDWSGFTDGKKPDEIQTKYEFWITPAALFRIKEAAEHTGIDEEAQKEIANTAELIEAMKGRQAVFRTEASKPDQNGRVFVNIAGTAALPA